MKCVKALNIIELITRTLGVIKPLPRFLYTVSCLDSMGLPIQTQNKDHVTNISRNYLQETLKEREYMELT